MSVDEKDLLRPEDVPKDCYFCAKAPKIDIGKPFCNVHFEHIEPTWTGKGPVGGWTCEEMARNCRAFKPREIYYDKEHNAYYEKRK